MPKTLPLLLLLIFLAACDDGATTPAPAIDGAAGGILPPIVQTQVALPVTPIPAAATIAAIGHESGPVARVNGVTISAADFNTALDEERLYAQEQSGAIDWNSPTGQKQLADLRDGTLEGLIGDALVVQAAAAEGVTVSAQETDQALAEAKKQFTAANGAFDETKYAAWLQQRNTTEDAFRQSIAQNLLFDKMVARKAAGVPDSEEQVHVRLIIVGDAAQAQKLHDQAVAGGDFGALAAQYSLDAVSKAKRGDADWLRRGAAGQSPDLEKAAFALTTPNQISSVVNLTYGYAILQLIERGTHPLPPDVVTDRRTAAFDAYLKDLRTTARIERLIKP